ncbi:MAG TPA: transglycosylase domain-containing protein [Nocardioides sp.]|nr:transglycosylase domain-containing protein [Nocardioides sp.]
MAGPRFDGLDKRKVASHIGVMMAVAAVLGIVVSGLAIPFAGVFGFTAKDLSNSASDLPKELTTEALPQRTEIVDSVGDPIATLYDQNRVNVQLSQISRTMVKAIVAIEDYRFYQHGALDMKGTLRALFTNSTQGGVVQGGSSITQQLVKQTLVNQADTVAEQKAAVADTFARKLRELRYAIALERLHSKDWILQQYLNTVYFGDGAYGIQAAAQHFFNVNAKDLTLPQAALLAGLVRSPEALNPTDNPQGAIERRNVVLDRMAQLNVISYRRADHFKKRGLHLDVQPTANGCVNSSAPFFCSYVVSYLMKDHALGNTKKERERVLWGGGLTIQTTMHPQFQHWATVAATTHVSKHDNAIGALAEVEPGTGDVWALAQSRPMGTDANAGQTFLNYTVPRKFGSANGFQPGSTFKFFVMAAALEEGLPETTSFYAPSTLNVSEGEFRTCRGMYPSTQIWPAHNSTDATDQTMDMDVGAPLSVNTYFAQLERRTGICKAYQLAKAMGVSLKPGNQVPSFTLGVADENPLTMASAYATAASGGTYCKPHPVSAILDGNGQVVKKYPTQCKPVLSEHTANTINSILHRVMSPGGFGANLLLNRPAAGKTGTNSENMAVWFNGYTPKLSVSTVVSGVNRAGHPIPVPPVLGGQYYGTAHGSTVAGPMWAAALRPVQDLIPYADFGTPGLGPDQSGLPSVLGSGVQRAMDQIKAAGYTPELAGVYDSSYARGEVAFVSMGADGQTVYLFTSTGHGAPAVAPVYHAPPSHKGHGGRGHHRDIPPATAPEPGKGHGKGH